MWQVWVDTGGTFTDCVAVDPAGTMRSAKLLSSGQVRGTISQWMSGTTLIAHLPGIDDPRGVIGWEIGAGSWAATAQAATVRDSQLCDDGSFELELDGRWSGSREPNVRCVLRGREPAPVLAARLATGTSMTEPLPAMTMRLATTRGTNALLQRTVASAALCVTGGFKDLLLIGDQSRADLFALRIDKRQPVYEHVIEVTGRISATGEIIEPLDEAALRTDARKALHRGAQVAAVALVNSYVNDAHERAVEDILRDIGFDVVARSAARAPLIGYVGRAETVVVDAALSLVISDYVQHVREALGDSRLLMLTSAGGLADAALFRAMDSLLSGPAGGVAGAAAAAKASGHERAIGFDMGGTSTDVSRYGGDFEYQFEHRVGGARVLAPALAIETVAAGGGSICRCAEDRLIVGPASAGAEPGPACYGEGGPLTLTDVNLLSGRIDALQFSIPIDVDAAQRAFDAVCKQAEQATGRPVDSGATLDGFIEIANARMASAIERISLRKGYDPKDYALVAFGGAGGQHACAVAQRLGMETVIVPRDASLLSAVGLGHAVIERFAQRQVLEPLDACASQWQQWLAEIGQEAIANVEAEGIARDEIAVRRRIVNARLVGQDSTLDLEVDAGSDVQALFEQRYRQVYGYAMPGRGVEIESMRVVASARKGDGSLFSGGGNEMEQREGAKRKRGRESFSVRMRAGGAWHTVTVRRRDAMGRDEAIDGPALITEPRSAIVVEPGWRARIDDAGAVAMKRTKQGSAKPLAAGGAAGEQSELARAELFAHRLTSIAVEMGQLLQRTAMSTNVKQRLDFSCAVLNADGELIVNAPHLPVHLGAMGVCVRAVREMIDIGRGDVVVTNHPACGGSHLPDVTVISAAHDDDGERIGYVANRAHHAEIGGTRPGSMPPDATRLIEEGVVIEPQYLVRAGESRFDSVERALLAAAYPSRAVAENIADLRAQAAANHFGAEALRRLAAAHGVDELHEQMRLIEARAVRVMRRAIDKLPARLDAEEFLDDGTRLGVVMRRDDDRLNVEVSGIAKPQPAGEAQTRPVGDSAQHPGNLNAPPALTHSAVLYVLRLLAGESMPLSEAMLRPVRITIAPGVLNPDFDAPVDELPAVVGGNVETSQRLVDTLIKALGLCACSQGTMNNTLFGNERFGYYETVCGGAGAGKDFDGADAVHTHMTNTRITDVEVLEQRYPVRVRRFEIRAGSGGAGEHKGGDGVVRELEFLEDVSLSLLSQHRVQRPFGMSGGETGRPGAQHVVRADGTVESLRGIVGVELRAGDVFVLETPGGGGWGHADSRKR